MSTAMYPLFEILARHLCNFYHNQSPQNFCSCNCRHEPVSRWTLAFVYCPSTAAQSIFTIVLSLQKVGMFHTVLNPVLLLPSKQNNKQTSQPHSPHNKTPMNHQQATTTTTARRLFFWVALLVLLSWYVCVCVD